MIFEQIAVRHDIPYIKRLATGGITAYDVLPFPDSSRYHCDERDPSSIGIRSIIIHYTELDFHDTCVLFTNNKTHNRVSSHYIVPDNSPSYVHLIPNNQRAWHAGISSFGPYNNLNNTSIGIEIVNRGLSQGSKHEWHPYKMKQIDICGQICREIIQQYDINPIYVLGHSDISPTRKKDPGPLFPWGYLYQKYGIGTWLDPDEMDIKVIEKKYNPPYPLPVSIDVDFFMKQLKMYGYHINEKNYTECLWAFKSHFSENSKNIPMFSDLTYHDMFWIWALNAKYLLKII